MNESEESEKESVNSGNDSDTGFYSENFSEDEVLEELEERGKKRKHSDIDTSSDRKKGKKLRKLRKENELKKLNKPPTADELNRLRETENLFHSNLFRLQIEEMLKEVTVKSKHKIEFESWYEKFADWVLKIEDSDLKYDLPDQEWLKKFKIKVPVLQVPYVIKGTYQFRKPSKVTLIGSYATNLLLGPKMVVDILVDMPQSFFQKEDYLNCRYHRKRALYMCELIHHIQLLPNLVEDVHFIGDETDNLKPLIEITPAGKVGKNVTVRLYFALEQGTYKKNRFSPSKNNVRWKWYFKENLDKTESIPTPFYNSTLAADLTIQENMAFLKDNLAVHNNIRDGIILLKIWLKQRGLDEGISGFNGFFVAMLVCFLLKSKKVNLMMSSYQVFRNVCHYLVGCDWMKNGITLYSSNNDDINVPTMTEFHENHKLVFVDVSGYHNLCYAMNPFVFKNIQSEAQLALNFLNNPNINSFQSLFITKVPFYQHYDHIVIFNNGELLENIADVHSSKQVQLSHCGVISPLIRDAIVSLLYKGFGKRVSQIHIKLPAKYKWKIEKKPKRIFTLIIGFNLEPNNYFSVVDKALESETEEFREFWGELSELRRFQDGLITEAVVWKGRTLSEKRLICREVLSYLLKSKFGLEVNDFQYVANQLDSYIGKDVEESCLKVSETFDELIKQLRDLSELPLEIVSVQGTSPVFRYTEVFPPFPQKQHETSHKPNRRSYGLIKTDLNSCPPWVPAHDIIIQMTASSKWPQDLEAIRRIRAAFNIKISESLSAQHGIICKAFQDKMEIIKNGFVFRLKVFYPNEVALLKRTVDIDGLIKYKDTEKSVALEKECIYLPKLSSALYGLYQEYNSFGPACCLVKRWISSHLIDTYYMSEESVELLVASLYLRPQPHEPPHQPQVAFFRFLYMVATTNWLTECIVLNINEELTREEILEIESDFNNNRQNLPPVFIATPYDRKKSIWTKDSPNSLILLRLIELCVNALNIIETEIYSKLIFDTKVLFKPCLDTYDVIITLNDSFNPRKKALSQKNSEFLTDYVQKIPVNDFDPVSFYLKELREGYSDFALFFHDTYGGSVIAVKWKPNTLEPCEFKVSNLAAHKYNDETKKLELNKEAILEDFWHIGSGLVTQIDTKLDGILKKYTPFSE